MKGLALVLISALLVTGVLASDPESTFEVISDFDLSYLVGNPGTPWGPDLFQKKAGYVAVEVEKPKSQLSGIVYDAQEPVAFINGRALRVGDRLGERRVVEIGRHFVVLELGASRTQLVLPPPGRTLKRVPAAAENGGP